MDQFSFPFWCSNPIQFKQQICEPKFYTFRMITSADAYPATPARLVTSCQMAPFSKFTKIKRLTKIASDSLSPFQFWSRFWQSWPRFFWFSTSIDGGWANAKANWENELNALQSEENVNIINTIKMTKQKNSSVQESSYIQVDRKVSTHAAAATNVDCAYNKVFSDETLSLTSASCKQTFDCGASSASSTTTTTDNDDVCRPPQPKTLNKTFDACCSDVKHSTPTKVSNFDVDCSYSRFQTTLKMENSPEKIQSNSFRTKIEELCSKNIIDL